LPFFNFYTSWVLTHYYLTGIITTWKGKQALDDKAGDYIKT